jgi:hypothetical protein
MAETDADRGAIVDRHLVAGWAALAIFVALGAVLEGLHAYKAAAYLDVGSEARRLLLRLSHAHGTLIALAQLGYAFTVARAPRAASRLASGALLAALALVPAGFFLGGLFAKDGDPGLGVALVPPGALALFGAAAVTAARLARRAPF